MTPPARSVEIARYLAAGRLSANAQPGIISREGMTIDSVRQKPHSPKGRPSLFFTTTRSALQLPGPNVRATKSSTQPFAGVIRIEGILLQLTK